ncbi:tyrosine-type recombinase/integrase [Psychrobacillus sp.]|uniref:tyrosine-type recombinase/integrase n=1 Tax=Psychrobacillus sp. TaxID=1871623 RepID=UPI0028BDDA7A|nr:tyrosine-type recombinase/integrase [Psychrobacillus sp.]
MRSVEPIWEDEWVSIFAKYFRERKERDYVLFMTGVYIGLRVSDILPLRVSHIENTHLVIYEQKTGKLKRIILHPHLQRILKDYTAGMKRTDLLFPSRNRDRRGRLKPIGRKRAYEIIKEAAVTLEYEGNLGTHSMRKTFGIRYYRQYKDVAELKQIFNHTSEEETYRYLGILRERIESNITAIKDVRV